MFWYPDILTFTWLIGRLINWCECKALQRSQLSSFCNCNRNSAMQVSHKYVWNCTQTHIWINVWMHSSWHTWLEDLLSFNEFSENVCVKLTDGNCLIAPVMLENDPKHECESFSFAPFLTASFSCTPSLLHD